MSKSAFELHPQLARDCHVLGRLGEIRVLLHGNAALDWFILVPEREAVELHELAPGDRRALEEAADGLARWLKERGADKINVAAIGNMVPQLHYHVVGRRRDDPAWPGVVWGNLPETDRRSPEEVETLVRELRAAGIDLA